MELFFVHEFAWSNRASTKNDDSKTQIISKCLHDSYSFKNKEYIHIKSLQRMLGQFYNQNLIQESRQEMKLF